MPFVLESEHPKAGFRRIELIEPRSNVSLKTDGEILLYYPGGPPRPEVLFFNAGAFTAVGELTLQHKELRPQLPEHNGTRAENGKLAKGDVFRWRDHKVTIAVTREPTREELKMADAASRSDAALLVYADWLETRGEKDQAEWARLVLQETPAAKARMAELATRVGIDFRSLVARGPVERCYQNCGRRWEHLQITTTPWVRSCVDCPSAIWCEDAEQARQFRAGPPVVLDPATPRKPGDLIPPMRPVG